MSIASFAGKEFSVTPDRIYPFNDFSLSGNISKEAQEREGQKPATYIKGLGLDNFTISIPLIAQKTVNVREQLESWRKIRDNRVPYFFIWNGKPIIPNKVILESVSIAEIALDGSGNMIKGKLQLKFEEYAATGSANKSTKKRNNPSYVESELSGEELEDEAESLFD